MADIFSTENIRELFKDKFIFLLGGSNMRATYKDFVQLINKNALLNIFDLRKRGEEQFQGDQRIVYSGMVKGRGYAEGREFVQHGVHLEYHFITRCYNEEIERFLRKIKDGSMKAPDVFIMNSCLWDISRWGPHGVESYKENMTKLMLLLKECLPSETLFIWTTTYPVSSIIRGGLLIKQIDFLQDMLRFEVMEANLFCRQLVVSYGYDVLDTHYHLRMQVHRRLPDGLHYSPLPVRLITNLVLTHVSLSWGITLPGRAKSIALKRVIQYGTLQTSSKSNDDVVLPKLPDCLNIESNQTNTNETEPVPRRNTARPYPRRRGRGPRRNGHWFPPARNNNHNYWQSNNQNWDSTPAGDSWQNNGSRIRPAVRFRPPRNNGENWQSNDQNWDLAPAEEADTWENDKSPMYPAARNELHCNNHHSGNLPPMEQPPPQHHMRNNNLEQTSTALDDMIQQAPWNVENKQQYEKSSNAGFNRGGGPVRKFQKFFRHLTKPY